MAATHSFMIAEILLLQNGADHIWECVRVRTRCLPLNQVTRHIHSEPMLPKISVLTRVTTKPTR
jgi:hypothetical protein